MRNCYLLFLVFCSLVAQGQNYQIIQPGQKRYFTNEGGLLKGIRIDSSKTENGDLILYPFKTPRGIGTVMWGSAQLDTNGGSWVGSEIRIQPDGLTMIDTRWGDTLFIKTRATLGEQWRFYDDTGSRYFLATVTSVGTAPVLNQTDSIKTITINVFNAGIPESGHIVDGKQLVLSKNHGLYETFSLHTFPYPGPIHINQNSFFSDVYMTLFDLSYSWNTVFSYKLIPFEFPDSTQLFDYAIGDVYATKRKGWGNNLPTIHILDSIIDKSPTAMGVEYTISRTEIINNQPPATTTVVPHHVFAGPMDFLNGKMPEEKGVIHTIQYLPNDTSLCYISPVYNINRISISTTGLWESLDLACFNVERYKLNLGHIRWLSCELPPAFERKMIYSRRNNSPCGTFDPLSVGFTQPQKAMRVYPNPAFNEVHIEAIDREFSWRIYSIDGRAMKSGTGTGKTSIEVGALPRGFYLLEYQENPSKKMGHQRLVLQ